MKDCKKILVISDTHGKIALIFKLVETLKPDMVIHLGDCISDADDMKYYPEISFCGVKGNCDEDETHSEIAQFTINGVRFFAVHGHHYGVKYHLNTLETAGRNVSANIVLYGHTHIPHLEYKGGLLIMNPGSLGLPVLGNKPSFGIITLNGKDFHGEIQNYI